MDENALPVLPACGEWDGVERGGFWRVGEIAGGPYMSVTNPAVLMARLACAHVSV